jgi:hypothetical protein
MLDSPNASAFCRFGTETAAEIAEATLEVLLASKRTLVVSSPIGPVITTWSRCTAE